MQKPINIVLVVLFFAALATPELNRRIGFLPERKLRGASREITPPVWDWREFRRGKLQAGFDAWYSAHLGLRTHAIVGDNTLVYRLFGESPAQSRVVVGKDDVLFIDEDIDYFNLAETRPAAERQAIVSLLIDFRAALQKEGKDVLVLFSPCKGSLYADKIPVRWSLAAGSQRPSELSSAALARVLEASGVPFADGRTILRAASQRTERELLYAPRGRHWTEYGACLVMRAGIAKLSPEMRARLNPIDCTGAYIGTATQRHSDNDLYRLLNMWNRAQDALTGQQWRERPPRSPPPSAPRVLFVGTSFALQLIGVGKRHGLFENVQFFWYNDLLYQAGQPSSPKLPSPGSPAWKELVLAHDLFIFESPEMWGHNVGIQFPAQYLDAF